VACAPSGTSFELPTPDLPEATPEWKSAFYIEECDMVTEGRNPFVIMEPGYYLVLESGYEVLAITVLDETLMLDGVETRVVEEWEWRDNELIEVSRNFFAICSQTGDVFYFGEDVDMYSGGSLTSHSGEWRSGQNDARFGLMMPSLPVLGMKYYQEIAPGVAMDRAEYLLLPRIQWGAAPIHPIDGVEEIQT
jgi:hypothetical protein